MKINMSVHWQKAILGHALGEKYTFGELAVSRLRGSVNVSTRRPDTDNAGVGSNVKVRPHCCDFAAVFCIGMQKYDWV